MSKCPCCGSSCELLFYSVECVNPKCQNFSSSLQERRSKVETSKKMDTDDDYYDEIYGYPLYGFWKSSIDDSDT